MEDRADNGAASWRTAAAYAYLYEVERRLFAWEWLRRTPAYRRAWLATCTGDHLARDRVARAHGLAALLDPAQGGATARPIWLVACDRSVVEAKVVDGMSPADRLDVRCFDAATSAMAVGPQGIEHWRLGSRRQSVRLDVIDGTLLGAPTTLAYEVAGLVRARPVLDALDTLLQLATPSRGRSDVRTAKRSAGRWILELRTADALAAGATQREMAETFFSVPASRWRRTEESYRLRIQRLVRRARMRLAAPLDSSWFSGV